MENSCLAFEVPPFYISNHSIYFESCDIVMNVWTIDAVLFLNTPEL